MSFILLKVIVNRFILWPDIYIIVYLSIYIVFFYAYYLLLLFDYFVCILGNDRCSKVLFLFIFNKTTFIIHHLLLSIIVVLHDTCICSTSSYQPYFSHHTLLATIIDFHLITSWVGELTPNGLSGCSIPALPR